MPVRILWYFPDYVVNAQMWGEFTFEELSIGSQETAELIRKGQAPVHDIIDMRYIEKYPLDVKQIFNATPVFREPNLGWVLLISDDRVVRFLTHMVLQLHKTRVRYCSTPAEALAFLREIDERLGELPPYVEPPV